MRFIAKRARASAHAHLVEAGDHHLAEAGGLLNPSGFPQVSECELNRVSDDLARLVRIRKSILFFPQDIVEGPLNFRR